MAKRTINGVPVTRPTQRRARDVKDWLNALVQAEGRHEQRAALYEIYKDTLIDARVISATQKREMSITNAKIRKLDKDGKVDEQATALVDTHAFEQLLEELMRARFWGHSLIELEWNKVGGEAKNKTHLIPREHVNPFDVKGASFRDPKLPVIEADMGGFGLLLPASLLCIYKRHALAYWAEHAESYGMPTRVGKYDEEGTRKALLEAFQKVGANGSIVVPSDAQIEAAFSSGAASSSIYKDLKAAIDDDLAIIFLGQTMTTKDGSSNAQAQVHKSVLEDLYKNDKEWILRILNSQLEPILRKLGYKEGYWTFVEQSGLSLKERLDIDLKVADRVAIDEEYWYKTYGIPKPKRKRANPKEVKQSETNHGTTCCDSSGLEFYEKKTVWNKLTSALGLKKKLEFAVIPSKPEADALGDALDGDRLPLVRLWGAQFEQAVDKGWDESMAGTGRTAKGARFRLRENAHVFASAKVEGLLHEIEQSQDPDKALQRHVRHLQTETWQFQGTAQMAAKRAGQLDKKDRYLLKYVTQGDDRTRREHQALDGLILEVDDKFWSKYYPPNGYNCRCDAVLVSKRNNKTHRLTSKQEKEAKKGTSELFQQDPARTGMAFDITKHPYTKHLKDSSQRATHINLEPITQQGLESFGHFGKAKNWQEAILEIEHSNYEHTWVELQEGTLQHATLGNPDQCPSLLKMLPRRQLHCHPGTYPPDMDKFPDWPGWAHSWRDMVSLPEKTPQHVVCSITGTVFELVVNKSIEDFVYDENNGVLDGDVGDIYRELAGDDWKLNFYALKHIFELLPEYLTLKIIKR